MKTFCISMIASLLLMVNPVYGDGAAEKSKAEIAWAKRVATEFFDSALSLSPRTDDIINEFSSSPLTFLNSKLAADIKEGKANNPIVQLVWQFPSAHFRIESEQMSPNQNEVILFAELLPLQSANAKKDYEKAARGGDLPQVLPALFLVRRCRPQSRAPSRKASRCYPLVSKG